MESEKIIPNSEIIIGLVKCGFTQSADEGRLILIELLIKAGAGYRSSHTEEWFLSGFDLLKADRTPNKKGRKFLCSMFYMHSNKRPEAYELMKTYRR